MQRLYLIRHCKAEGQETEASLTPEGEAQAEGLAEFLAGAGIRRILSSPMRRAVQSVQPLARRLRLPIETDARLVERALSGAPRTDWQERLRESFDDIDLRLEGGESTREAMARVGGCVDDLLRSDSGAAAIATHGALLSALLRRFDPGFGFAQWQALTNPDLFRVTITADGTQVDRQWQ